MARPKEFVPEEVLEQAMLTFWRRGYDGASTAELAAQMGIGKRSMYDTFGDKHALYLASLRHYMRQVDAAKAEAAARATTLADALREVLGPPPQVAGRPAGCFATLAAADVTDDDTEVRELVAAHFDRSRERVRAQIRRFTGRVPTGAEEVVTIACDAALGYRVRARSGAVRSGQIDRLVEFVCAQV